MRVAILDDYQGVAQQFGDWDAVGALAEIATFADHLADEPALAERLHDAEIVVAMRERTPFPRTLIERLPNLQLLVTTGMRNAAIDLNAAREAGVTVCGTGGLGSPTAELTWGLILALLRRIPAEHAAVRAGQWQTGLGEGVQGKTLGVLGLGRLGGQVATIGRAFEMSVLAWSQNLTRARTDEIGVTLAASKEELLERSDIVTVHLVLSDRTRGLIGGDELDRMPSTAYLVNTSRGPIVEEPALVEALRTRSIAGAALDVFDQEPLPPEHPLLRLDNVVLTPHIGYVTRETYAIFLVEVVEDILAFLGDRPVRVLNA
ncbi:MAG: D-2-hydroxyacid dehydrogenase family protein [Chloroflexi bacterium]|nr:D-2-hydroxyacid dehydrogenase family protein [Chloroflexota bacterium]